MNKTIFKVALAVAGVISSLGAGAQNPSTAALAQSAGAQNPSTAAQAQGAGAQNPSVIKPGETFRAGDDWMPIPAYSDREAWDALTGDSRAELIRSGERFLDYEWKTIPATAYLEYERSGDRSSMESRQNANRNALIALMMAELAEGKGRFTDQLMNGAWLATEQTSWVLSAHQPRQRTKRSLPDRRETLIDLGSGRYGAIIALAYHFFHEEFDKQDSSINVAIREAVKRNILDPFLNEQENRANWWLGFTRKKPTDLVNNWNPWCNADVALCFLLMENDQQRLDAAMDKSIRSIAEFTSYIKQDGACEEGPSYWGAAVGKLVEWALIMNWGSHGSYDRLGDPLIRDMVDFISRSYIGDGYVVNFADASPLASNNPELVWRCGRACGSKEVSDFALYCLGDNAKQDFRRPKSIGNDAMRAILDIYYNKSMNAAVDSLRREMSAGRSYNKVHEGLRAGVPAATWYPQTQFCFIRGAQGWFFGGKGGHNNESHNHNDIGTCLLYVRNTPVLCDAGVGTYTKQTFSEDRYSIWTMQSDWHNLPMINGSSQIYGVEFKAENTVCDTRKGTFALNIDKAYMEAAHCISWRRSYTLALKGQGKLTICDDFRLDARVAPDVENFLVQGEVILPGEKNAAVGIPAVKNGELYIVCKDGVKVKMTYPTSLKASVEVREMTDAKLEKAWGSSLRRISLTSRPDAPLKGRYVITFSEVR